MMARLLADKKKAAQERLEPDYKLDDRVKAEFLPKLAQRVGASSVVEKIRDLRAELDKAVKELSKFGFEYDNYDGDIDLTSEAPEELRQALAEAERSARKERDAELKVYDVAILNVWAAGTAAEARKNVEELL